MTIGLHQYDLVPIFVEVRSTIKYLVPIQNDLIKVTWLYLASRAYKHLYVDNMGL